MTWIDGTGYVVSPLDGVNDILIAVVDGREGFPEAIAAVYPQTVVGCSSVLDTDANHGDRGIWCPRHGGLWRTLPASRAGRQEHGQTISLDDVQMTSLVGAPGKI